MIRDMFPTRIVILGFVITPDALADCPFADHIERAINADLRWTAYRLQFVRPERPPVSGWLVHILGGRFWVSRGPHEFISFVDAALDKCPSYAVDQAERMFKEIDSSGGPGSPP